MLQSTGGTVPERLTPRDLSALIARRLALAATDSKRVVWTDRGDEVLVHLDSVQVQIAGGALLIAVELETDQTGRQPLVVALALGGEKDRAGLIAATDALPRGHGALAARWGVALQDAVWTVLLELAQAHAAASGAVPRGFVLAPDALHLATGPAR